MVRHKQTKQLVLKEFPSELEKKPVNKNKQIIITKIISIAKFDEMALLVDFKLIPSKIEFSRVRLTLWFDDQEAKSALIRIPQGFGISDEFQLKSELDLRQINAGTHIIKIEIHDLFSSCFGIGEETIEYTPRDKKAGYRKIPLIKKIEGEGVDVISEDEKTIYQEIQETRKKDVISRRDNW